MCTQKLTGFFPRFFQGRPDFAQHDCVTLFNTFSAPFRPFSFSNMTGFFLLPSFSDGHTFPLSSSGPYFLPTPVFLLETVLLQRPAAEKAPRVFVPSYCRPLWHSCPFSSCLSLSEFFFLAHLRKRRVVLERFWRFSGNHMSLVFSLSLSPSSLRSAIHVSSHFSFPYNWSLHALASFFFPLPRTRPPPIVLPLFWS